MSYQSTKDPFFLSVIEQWLRHHGEVTALIRYSHSAGSKSFEFFSNMEAFSRRLMKLPPKTCVIAFRETQLPLRGQVDEDFINEALTQIGDGAEYLITGLEEVIYGETRWLRFISGESHAELREDLQDCLGEQIAVGVYPPWLYDTEQVVSAVVPGLCCIIQL